MKLKNVLVLMSAMLVLTLSCFGQTQTNEDPYKSFLKAQLKDGHKVDTLSKLSDIKYDRKSLTISNLSSGNYFIKARNQMITGVVMQTVAGIIYFKVKDITTKIYKTNYGDSKNPSYQKDLTQKYNNIIKYENYSAGVLAIVGTVFEISGICNIGKAGLCFNQNGVGLKRNF